MLHMIEASYLCESVCWVHEEGCVWNLNCLHAQKMNTVPYTFMWSESLFSSYDKAIY